MKDENTDAFLSCIEDRKTGEVYWVEIPESDVPSWVWEFEGDEGDGEGEGEDEGEWEAWEEWAEQIWGYDETDGTEYGYMHDWRADHWLKYDGMGNWQPISDEEVPQWVHDELDGGEDKEIILPYGQFIDDHYWYGWYDNEG